MPLYNHRFGGVTALGTTWQFGFWGFHASNAIDAQHALAVTFLNAVWTDTFSAQCRPETGARQITTALVTQSTGQQQDLRQTAVTLNGASATATQLPTDCSVVVSLRTATINRRGRGRLFTPPLATSSLTSLGRLAAAVQTDMADAFQAAFAGYNSGTLDAVVYSRVDRQVRPITGIDVGDLFDTQRGRQDVPETRTTRVIAT